jgi:uncharacterized protein YukE
MADEIHYDYQSMDHAYENMKRIANNIQNTCQDMSQDALRLLQSNGGSYAEGYQAKLTRLNADIQELNDEMTTRAAQLQAQFNAMAEADIRLGDGF